MIVNVVTGDDTKVPYAIEVYMKTFHNKTILTSFYIEDEEGLTKSIEFTASREHMRTIAVIRNIKSKNELTLHIRETINRLVKTRSIWGVRAILNKYNAKSVYEIAQRPYGLTQFYNDLKTLI